MTERPPGRARDAIVEDDVLRRLDRDVGVERIVDRHCPFHSGRSVAAEDWCVVGRRATLRRMKWVASALFLFGLGVAACGPGSAAKAVRPADPTATDALGKNTSCKGLSDEPQLLTLDWDDTLRIDLEQGMKKGVVVVKYDCDGFKVLRDCDLQGTYEFAGFSQAKTIAKIDDQDQLEANLPIGAAKMSGEIKRGSTIDLVYIAVGQQSTTVHDVPATRLAGKCEGATHTVRSANVGAFAVTTGTKGQVNAAVEVLSRGASGSSTSAKSLERENGELAACDGASDSSPEPTAKCKALVQLLLSPIGGKASDTEEASDPKSKDKTKGPAIQADPIKERLPDGLPVRQIARDSARRRRPPKRRSARSRTSMTAKPNAKRAMG